MYTKKEIRFFLTLVGLISVFGFYSCASRSVTESNSSNRPVMTEKNSSNMSSTDQEKNLKYLASGGNPVWSLSIGADLSIKFNVSLSPEFNFTAPVSNEKVTSGFAGEMTSWEAETESGKIVVNFLASRCIDKQTNDTFPFAATVILTTGKGEKKIFSGCGRKAINSDLNRHWQFASINGTSIEKPTSGKQIPDLEFDLSENRFSGSTGCNRMMGSVEVQGNTLSFGTAACTRMMCPDAPHEPAILKALTSTTYQYKIEKNRLILYFDGKEVMILKPIE